MDSAEEFGLGLGFNGFHKKQTGRAAEVQVLSWKSGQLGTLLFTCPCVSIIWNIACFYSARCFFEIRSFCSFWQLPLPK